MIESDSIVADDGSGGECELDVALIYPGGGRKNLLMSQSKNYRWRVSIDSGKTNIMMLAHPNIKLAKICLSWCRTLTDQGISVTLDTDGRDLNEGKQRLQRLLVENSGHSVSTSTNR